MTTLPFKIVKVLLVMFAFCSMVFSQIDRSMPVVPCLEDSPAGRPTLKRRQSTPDTARGSESDKPQAVTEEKPCTVDRKDSDSAVDQDSVKVRFEGLHAYSESDVLKLFREKRVGFPKDRMPDRAVIEKAVAVLKELFEARGYQQIAADARADDQSNTITFLVDEGPRFQIAEINFEGSRIFSSQDLAARMREYLNRYESSKNGYDAEIFDYCMHTLANFVRSQGYLKAKFGEPKKAVKEGGLVITVHVDEGILYRVGEINIAGARAISPQQVRTMLSLQPGDTADGATLSKWLFEDLKETYGELGYIQYTAEVTPEFESTSEGAGVVNLKVDIDEGSLFKIRKIKFTGASLSQDELRGLLLINEGAIFNQRLFEDSIKKLNENGLFEFIDKDRDVDFRSDAEGGLLDLAIKLTRRNN